MFGKSKSNAAAVGGVPAPVQQFQRLVVAQSAPPESPDTVSCISADVTVVGKITGEGTVKVFGRIDGELHASTVVIADGAQVEGDLVADDVTVGGRVKGTIHADRVKLNSTANVQGDIFHRSLAIEENARFEGSSRRDDSAAETSARDPASRPQVPVAVPDGGRKLNGAPETEAHAAAG